MPLRLFALGVVKKYASQALFLLLPRIFDYGLKRFAAWRKMRKLAIENMKKGDAYADAKPDSSHDAFRDLP